MMEEKRGVSLISVCACVHANGMGVWVDVLRDVHLSVCAHGCVL